MDRILIDECLSPGLVGVAKERGHDATHVVWLGAQGMQDWNLIALVARNDFVFVTNDRADFLRLFGELGVHNGLIILVPKTVRSEQIRLFNLALDAAEREDNLINRVIEVNADGSVTVRKWPKG
jgi:predicted nuclease of predicted toxin-antitoxin system